MSEPFGSRFRLLVVEDEAIVARDVQATLEAAGHEVVGLTGSGEEALALAARARPDLVLMDIRLQGPLDGVAAARRLREELGLPVLFLTAYADPDTLEAAASAEPYGYVLKPFDERELTGAVMMAVWKHRAFAELDRRVQERSAELARAERKYRQLAAVSELGLFAIRTRDVETVLARALEVVGRTLEVDLTAVLELRADEGSLLLRAGTGWPEGEVGTARVPTGRQSLAGFTLLAHRPVLVEALAGEERFTPCPLVRDQGVVSAVSAVIEAPIHDGVPFGVLLACSKRPRRFGEGDALFLQAAANVLAAALLRDILETRQREAEQRMQGERLRAEHAQRAIEERDEFLSVAAHELRTPLSALLLKLQGLRRLLGQAGPPRGTERLEGAIRQTERLNGLIERLLDASRAVAQRLEVHRAPADLGLIAEQVMDEFREQAERAGAPLSFERSGDLRGDWDAGRLSEVLENLVANALKYGAGSKVVVRLSGERDRVHLEVSDGGIGIPEDQQQHIFERFGRAAPLRHYGGLGLGLFLCRHFVEAHGGTIRVRSRPGEGATFLVELPRQGRRLELEEESRV